MGFKPSVFVNVSETVAMMLADFVGVCSDNTDRLLYVWDANAKDHHGNVGVLRWR